MTKKLDPRIVDGVRVVLRAALGSQPAMVIINAKPCGHGTYFVTVMPVAKRGFQCVQVGAAGAALGDIEDEDTFLFGADVSSQHVVLSLHFLDVRIHVSIAMHFEQVKKTGTCLDFHYAAGELKSADFHEKQAKSEQAEEAAPPSLVHELNRQDITEVRVGVLLLLLMNGGSATLQEVSSLSKSQLFSAFRYLRDLYKHSFLHVKKKPSRAPKAIVKFIGEATA